MTARKTRPLTLGARHYLIAGNSAAGLAAAREIRRHDPRGSVTIVSGEPTLGYSRVLLPLYLSGKISKGEMVVAPREFYSSLRIRLLRADPLEAVDPAARIAVTRKGKKIPYDRLLLATGASPRSLGVPGEDLLGVHCLRTLADGQAIRQGLRSTPGPLLLAGGGLVGVKSLEALTARGRKVHLVVSSDRVLSQMLDLAASDLFLEAFRRQGVSVHLRSDVRAFTGRERLQGALLADGTHLPCALAIVGKGVSPNVGFLRGSGIALDQGILVDRQMAASQPCIYAAGDAAQVPDLLPGKPRGNAIWPLAAEGGRVAGANMASAPALLPGSLRMNAVEVFGLRAVSVGSETGERVLSHRPPGAPVYRKLVFSGGRLTGFLLAGDIGCAGVLTALIRNRTPVSVSALEEGLRQGFSFSPRLRSLAGEVRFS